MNILIAGGSGLLGQELIRELVRKGHEVWVLTRSPEAARLPEGVRAAGWDGRTVDGWGHLVGEVEAIINLAGANIGARPWTNERKRLIRASRVEPGQAIVEAVRQSERRPRVVIQIAGVGYYGIHGDEPLDEQSPVGKDYLAGVAADWEKSTQAVADIGVRHVIMRTGAVLTPKEGILAPFVLQNNLFAGGPIGSGKQWVSWIHVRDLIRATQFFLEREDARGVFNVTSPNPVPNREFGRTVSQVMGRPFWAPVPGFMLQLVMGEMSTLVLDGQRVLPRRLEEMGFQFEFADLRAAVADLLRKKD